MKRNSPDYLLKSLVIESGLHKKLNAISYQRYANLKDGIVVDPVLDQQMLDLVCEYGHASMLEAKRINNASYKRVERLRDRIYSFLCMGKCKFVTLTFDPETLDNTSVKTRRQYVSRFLKSISDYYVANIDYGIDDRYTHREHYHAIVVTDWTDEKWEHGFYKYETCDFRDRSSTIMAKYVNKLTNHAIKESTKRCCYIYYRVS